METRRHRRRLTQRFFRIYGKERPEWGFSLLFLTLPRNRMAYLTGRVLRHYRKRFGDNHTTLQTCIETYGRDYRDMPDERKVSGDTNDFKGDESVQALKGIYEGIKDSKT